MSTLPPLLKTYEEARLLLEAKGWGMAKAADHLSEMPGLKHFHISQAKLSRKTAPGSKFPIEPEVAAAIEGMETRVGYERQTEIITSGLLALHGDPPIVDVDRLAAELQERLPASELALKLVEALEEKSGQRLTRLSQKLAERSASELTPKLVEAVEAFEEKASQRAASFFQTLAEKLGRVSGKQIAISAGSGALVALLLVPLLSAHAFPTPSAGPVVLIISNAGPGGSPVWFEPGSLSAISDPGMKRPADQPIPVKLLPGQKAPPCDSQASEEAINAGCWIEIVRKPPCGRYFSRGDKCYAPVAANPMKLLGAAPDHPSGE